MNQKILTKTEEQVMQTLWRVNRAGLKILADKGFANVKDLIKKITVIMSVVAAAFLFACSGGGSSPPTMTIIGAEHNSSEAAAAIIAERREANVVAERNSAVSESNPTADADDRPRNTKYADADGNPTHPFWDVYGRRHTNNYFVMDVKPLFNGNEAWDEVSKFIVENSGSLQKIILEHNIKEGKVQFGVVINTDGTADAVILEGTTHEALGVEAIRLIKSMQEHGKWTPGEYGGEIIKTRIPIFSVDVGSR